MAKYLSPKKLRSSKQNGCLEDASEESATVKERLYRAEFLSSKNSGEKCCKNFSEKLRAEKNLYEILGKFRS